jgi:hypothetical protein
MEKSTVIWAMLVVLSQLAGIASAQGWAQVIPPSSAPSIGNSAAYDPTRSVSASPRGIYNGSQIVSGCPSGTQGVYYDPSRQELVAHSLSHNGQLSSINFSGWDGTNWNSIGSFAFNNNLAGGYPGTYTVAFDTSTNQPFLIVANQYGAIFTFVCTPNTTSAPLSQLFITPFSSFSTLQLRIGIDPTSTRIQMHATNTNTGLNIPTQRLYQLDATGWIQQYPQWFFPAGGIGSVFVAASNYASGPSSLGMMSYTHTLSPTTGAVVPRTCLYRNGSASELFLNSYPPELASSLTYDSNRGVFVAFVADGSIWELNLGPSAQFSTFGAGCLGSRSTPALAPQQGNLPRVGTNFTLQALNLPLAGPVFLAIGASDTVYGPTPLPLNLGPLGAPQCNLLIGIDNLYPTSNVLGAAAWTFPIPNIPGGIFFSQAVVFDPPANTFGLTLSNGGRGVIGS